MIYLGLDQQYKKLKIDSLEGMIKCLAYIYKHKPKYV